MCVGRNLVYLYDGSFEGILTAMYLAYKTKKMPDYIALEENHQKNLLCEYVSVQTNIPYADFMYTALMKKSTQNAMHNIYYAYLSNDAEKANDICSYIRMCFVYGKKVDNYMTKQPVMKMIECRRRVTSEAHKYLGFIRFSELNNGIFYAVISPESNVLPLIGRHFFERFGEMQPFIIHDKLRETAIFSDGNKWFIAPAEGFVKDSGKSIDENEYKRLWRCFYNTIAIEERKNERKQMQDLPKKYRSFMTEFIPEYITYN